MKDELTPAGVGGREIGLRGTVILGAAPEPESQKRLKEVIAIKDHEVSGS